MKRIPVLMMLLLMITGYNLTMAQQDLSLSLEDARSYAIEYNKVLKNAGLAVDAARKGVMETTIQMNSVLPGIFV